MAKAAVLGLLALLPAPYALGDQCSGDLGPCETRSSSLLQKGWDVAAALQPQEDPLEEGAEVAPRGRGDEEGPPEDAGEGGEADAGGEPGGAPPPGSGEAAPEGGEPETSAEEAGPAPEAAALLAGGWKPTLKDVVAMAEGMKSQLQTSGAGLAYLARIDILSTIDEDYIWLWWSNKPGEGVLDHAVARGLGLARAAAAAMEKFRAYRRMKLAPKKKAALLAGGGKVTPKDAVAMVEGMKSQLRTTGDYLSWLPKSEYLGSKLHETDVEEWWFDKPGDHYLDRAVDQGLSHARAAIAAMEKYQAYRKMKLA